MDREGKIEVMRYDDMNSIKRNKTSIAKETVYDRCAYVGCYNGKFINGRRLYHFPAETDRRLEMWIERSGNFRLRTWAATSLRKAGLCGDHFDDKSFTNGTRKSLRRNVVPRHYTEDLKYRRANDRGRNEDEKDFNMSENEDDPKNTDTSSQSPTDTVSSSKNFGENIRRELLLDLNNCLTEKTNRTSTRLRSPSPVVEFIVEELDESLIEGQSPMVQTSTRDEGEEIDDSGTETSMIHREIEEETKPMMGSVTQDDCHPMNDRPAREEVSRKVKVELPWIKSEIPFPGSREEIPEISENIFESSEEIGPPIIITPDHGGSKDNHRRIIENLRNENKQLRKTMRLLKQNLRRSKAREENYMRVREMLKNVDEFLNIQECTNPVARAMVKLTLHKPKTPYTNEEKEFAAELYRNSSAAFIRLRRAGCNFPGRSTMKRWIAEENNDNSTFDCILSHDGDDDDDSVADETTDYHKEIIADLDQPNNYANEVVIDMNEAADDVEMAINELVEHLEQEIADVDNKHEEYIEPLPPQDDFK